MKHIGLFEGIGGFSLAAHMAGWETIAWCEWNEFGQQNLKYHFPNATAHGDITKTDFTIYRGKCDILTGGFPCQPYSTAGKRLGKEDERHLWPEMLRAIREIQPRWVVGENVRGIINWSEGLVFQEVCAELETEGYEVQPFLLPAAGINAPHERYRVWFVAYNSNTRPKSMQSRRENAIHGFKTSSNSNSNGFNISNRNNEINTSERREYAQCNIEQSLGNGITSNTGSKRLQRSKQYGTFDKGFRTCKSHKSTSELHKSNNWENFPTQSPICSGDDGLPTELDGITFSKWRQESIKAYGNAIVPQLALQIFKAINEYEHAHRNT